MKAVILAAGEGVRLHPITTTRPKPMINVGGKPILEYCLDALKFSKITEVIIVHIMCNDNDLSYLRKLRSLSLHIIWTMLFVSISVMARVMG